MSPEKTKFSSFNHLFERKSLLPIKFFLLGGLCRQGTNVLTNVSCFLPLCSLSNAFERVNSSSFNPNNQYFVPEYSERKQIYKLHLKLATPLN